MTMVIYDKQLTALLVIDPYTTSSRRAASIRPAHAAPSRKRTIASNMNGSSMPPARRACACSTRMHHRYRPGDYETWKYIAPIQKAAWSRKTFEYGTWGGEFRADSCLKQGEIVASEHWCSSGFANTDLDLQLKKHGIISSSSSA